MLDWLAAMVCGFCLCGGVALAQAPDLVLINGNIYTVNVKQPRAEALAVRAGRIVAVGSNSQIRALAGPGTKTIDAAGNAVVPGLIDAHGHMSGLGDALQELDLLDLPNPQAAADLVKKDAARRKPGEWIRGRGWDQNKWPGREFPTHDVLTAAAPDNPVYLVRVDGHAAWVNRKAMEMAGIDATTPDPTGGRLIRDAAGRPSGVLVDNAESLVNSHIPPPTHEQRVEMLMRAAQECVRFGLAGVHDAGVPMEVIDAYKELIAQKRLPLRVYAMIGGSGPMLDEYLKRGPEIGYGDAHLTVRSIKMYADGALGSRGAALLEPYSDEPGNRGLMVTTALELERVCTRALDRGFQVNTHAIGDRGNRVVLDVYEAALQSRKEFPKDHRFRIEHAQVLSAEDLARLAPLGIIASMQATHATSDMPWAERRLGPERVKGAYAWQTLIKLGTHFANGSDFPVESPNPLWGFYASVTRQDHEGNPPGGWFPDQRLTREQALKSFTLGAAYAAFEEKEKGSLEPGKLADFVILSRDIMTIEPREVLKTEVLRTVVGGETVYEKK